MNTDRFLYEIPRGSKLRLEVTNTQTGKTTMQDCTFDHLDGMYSYIKVDESEDALHLSAMTPMTLVNGMYQIDVFAEALNEGTDDHYDVTDPREPADYEGDSDD